MLETVEMAYRVEKEQPDQPILEQEAVETDMELCQSQTADTRQQQLRAYQPANSDAHQLASFAFRLPCYSL